MGVFRVYLASAVLAGHSGVTLDLPFVEANVAVLVFFCISGFLITYVLMCRYKEPRDLPAFYRSRALRIFPIYLIVLLVTVVLGGSGLVDTSYMFGEPGDPLHNISAHFGSFNIVTQAVIAFANLTTVFQDSLRELRVVGGVLVSGGLYPEGTPGNLPAIGYNILGQAWTLSAELMFYAIAPFIVRRPWRIAVGLVVVTTIMSFGANGINVGVGGIVAVLSKVWLVFPQHGSIGTLAFFLTGAALCHLLLARGEPKATAVAGLLSLSGLIIVGMSTLHARGGVGAATLVTMTALIPVLFHISRNNAWDIWIADLSYPIYIVHMIVVQAAFTLFASETSSCFYQMTIYAGTLLAAALLAVVDRWIRHRPKPLLLDAPPSPTAASNVP